jgi:hypothetical protein
MPGIFLSYRREDAGGHAGRLYDQLQEHFGKRNVFRDIDTLLPGADFVDHIESAIAGADVVVAVIGRDWSSATSASGQRRLDEPEDYVRLELEAALRRGIPLLPVLVRNATMPRREELPSALAPLTRRPAFELPDQHWPYAVKALLDALEQHVKPEPEETRDDGAGRERREGRSRTYDFLTSAPALLGGLAALITAVTGVIVVLRNDDGPGPSPPPPPAAATSETGTTPTEAVVGFTETDDPPIGEGTVSVEGETVLLRARSSDATGGSSLGVVSESSPVSDVSIGARARWESGAKDYGAGVICRYRGPREYYMFVVFSDGNYNVARYDPLKAQGPRWLKSLQLPEHLQTGRDFRVQADCVGDDPTRLTLRVNGVEVWSRPDDDGIESGLVGIRGGTKEPDGVTIRFDGFVIDRL